MPALIKNQSWLVSVFPQRGRQITCYSSAPGLIYVPPPAPLVATVSPTSSTVTTIALSGTNAAGLNIYTVVGPNTAALDTLLQTVGTESLPSLASAIAAKVNALALPGITATTSGPSIMVTGSTPVWCNIGQPILAKPTTGYPIMVSEVARFERDVQITIWAATPDNDGTNNDGNMESLENAVLTAIGGSDQAWNLAPDGSAFKALWTSSSDWNWKGENSYSTFRSDNFLTLEYPLLKPVAATPVGAVQLFTQYANANPLTQIFGGP